MVLAVGDERPLSSGHALEEAVHDEGLQDGVRRQIARVPGPGILKEEAGAKKGSGGRDSGQPSHLGDYGGDVAHPGMPSGVCLDAVADGFIGGDEERRGRGQADDGSDVFGLDARRRGPDAAGVAEELPAGLLQGQGVVRPSLPAFGLGRRLAAGRRRARRAPRSPKKDKDGQGRGPAADGLPVFLRHRTDYTSLPRILSRPRGSML